MIRQRIRRDSTLLHQLFHGVHYAFPNLGAIFISAFPHFIFSLCGDQRRVFTIPVKQHTGAQGYIDIGVHSGIIALVSIKSPDGALVGGSTGLSDHRSEDYGVMKILIRSEIFQAAQHLLA
jgi:hypothetical protein